MEIAPTSYLRVNGASIVDGSDTAVRLQGPCRGGWMNMENFITGYPASETLQRRALLKAMGPEAYDAFFDQFLTDFSLNQTLHTLPTLAPTRCASRSAIAISSPMNSRRSSLRLAYGGSTGPWTRWRLTASTRSRPARRPWIPKPPLALRQPNALAALLGVRRLQGASQLALGGAGRSLQGQRVVAGFNLLNEPADEEGDRLIAWYSETARRVRHIDPDRMLFLDGNKYSTDFSMFTEPLANTVYTAHDYVMAGLDPHGHYPGELDGGYPGSAKGDVYNKDTIHEQFLRRTAFMRDLGLPIWIGEFGPLYNGTPQQAEERYQLLQDQLDIYRDYQASWALWLYKDIGLQGLVFAATDSPYMALLKDFLAKKERLGADSWGGTDDHIRDVVHPIESLLAREFPDFNPYPLGPQKWAARLLRHILISEALIPEFAERFHGITPTEARELAGSFRWESCTRRIGLEQTLRLELAKG